MIVRSSNIALAVAVAAITSLAACTQHRPVYDWGEYQESLYVMWVEPEDFDLADQIRILEDGLVQTEAKNELVPPGVRAHLGYLYSRAGNTGESVRWLEAEKAAFPESKVFVDGLLARMNR